MTSFRDRIPHISKVLILCSQQNKFPITLYYTILSLNKPFENIVTKAENDVTQHSLLFQPYFLLFQGEILFLNHDKSVVCKCCKFSQTTNLRLLQTVRVCRQQF